MENVMAFDLSTKSTGWATKVNEKLKYGCIENSRKDNRERIVYMRDSVIDLLKEYNITKIICEEVPETETNNVAKKTLTWLQAAVVIAVYEYNKDIEIDFVYPNSWRKKLGIHTGAGVKRNTLKQKDMEYVKNKYSIEVNDDIADAIGILDSYDIPDIVTTSDGFEFG